MAALVLLLVHVWAVVYLLGLWNVGYDMGDEGLALMNGWRLAAGQLPHRDVFEITPPVSFWVTAAVFELTGPTVFGARMLCVVYGLLLVLLGERLLSRYSGDLPARLHLTLFLLPFGVSLWRMPSHHWLADILQLGAALALLEALDAARPRRWALLGGALTGLAGLSLQDQGALFAVALLVAFFPWLGERRRPLLSGWLAGIGVAAVPVLGYLAAHGALGEFWRQCVVFPLTAYYDIPGNEPSLARAWAEILPAGGWSAIARSPLAGFGIAGSRLVINLLPFLAPLGLLAAYLRGWSDRPRLGPLTALLVAFLATALRRYNLANLVWAAPALLVVASLALARLRAPGKPPAARRLVTAALVLASLLWTAYAGRQLVHYADERRVTRIETRAGTLRVHRNRPNAILAELLQGIDANLEPDQPLFVYGYAPLLNFLSQHPNPTRFNFFLYPGYHRQPELEELLLTLERTPRAAVLTRLPLPQRFGWLAQLLRERYRVVWQGAGVGIFERVRAGPPTAAEPER